MSTLAVVEEILRESKVPMSVREIVERAGPTLPTKSKTPDTVVARDLSMDIKKKGEESLFIRTSPGRYTMRAYVVAQPVPQPEAAAAPTLPPASQPAEIDGQPTSVLASSLRGERAPTKPAPRQKDDDRNSSVSI